VLLSTCNVKPFLWRGPSVVVLQSLQYLHFPEQFGRARGAYLKHGVKASLHAADAVIAVTDWERSEAIRLFGLDPDRVFTVYHGLSGAVARASFDGLPRPSSVVGDEPYVIMVSSLYRFKNHERLIQAFAGLVRERPVPHRLVLVGGDADVTRSELATLAERLGIGDRVLLPGPVPHDDVPALIRHADAVAYVSLYETFGHPVIEALAAGRPLVTTDRGATAEVAGGAARLVDATSVESIAAGLGDVLLDDTLRAALAAAGPRRASTFTWASCARGTATALEFALSRHRGPLGDKRAAGSHRR
jgi:glycosyltransferase involved in cell wall biosynthesis